MSSLSTYESSVRKRFPKAILLDCKTVGYPFYHALLNLTLGKDRDLTTQEQFTMDAIESGLRSRDKIRNFLGVEEFFVDDALSGLSSNGFLSRTSEGLELTDKGKDALEKQKVDDVVIETHEIYIDALVGKVHLERDLNFNSIKDPSYIIQAVKPRVRAELSNFAPYMDQIQDALERGEKNTELIGIESVNFAYQEWHKLDFVTFQPSPNSEQVQYFFFSRQNIEAVYREHIEELQAKGEHVLEDILEDDLAEPEEDDEREGAAPPKLGIPDSTVEEATGIKTQLIEHKSRLEKIEDTVDDGEYENGSTDKGKETLRMEVSNAQDKLEQIREEKSRLKERLDEIEDETGLVDVIHTAQIREYLRKSFREASQKILIIVPWVTRGVVDGEFQDRLETTLSRGVDVNILFGYKDNDDDPKAVGRLEDTASKYDMLNLEKVYNTHSKVLACDYKFGIVSSFNYLSFRADPDKTYRDETGLLVNNRSVIEKLYKHGDDLVKESGYLVE